MEDAIHVKVTTQFRVVVHASVLRQNYYNPIALSYRSSSISQSQTCIAKAEKPMLYFWPFMPLSRRRPKAAGGHRWWGLERVVFASFVYQSTILQSLAGFQESF